MSKKKLTVVVPPEVKRKLKQARRAMRRSRQREADLNNKVGYWRELAAERYRNLDEMRKDRDRVNALLGQQEKANTDLQSGMRQVEELRKNESRAATNYGAGLLLQLEQAQSALEQTKRKLKDIDRISRELAELEDSYKVLQDVAERRRVGRDEAAKAQEAAETDLKEEQENWKEDRKRKIELLKENSELKSEVARLTGNVQALADSLGARAEQHADQEGELKLLRGTGAGKRVAELEQDNESLRSMCKELAAQRDALISQRKEVEETLKTIRAGEGLPEEDSSERQWLKGPLPPIPAGLYVTAEGSPATGSITVSGPISASEVRKTFFNPKVGPIPRHITLETEDGPRVMLLETGFAFIWDRLKAIAPQYAQGGLIPPPPAPPMAPEQQASKAADDRPAHDLTGFDQWVLASVIHCIQAGKADNEAVRARVYSRVTVTLSGHEVGLKEALKKLIELEYIGWEGRMDSRGNPIPGTKRYVTLPRKVEPILSEIDQHILRVLHSAQTSGNRMTHSQLARSITPYLVEKMHEDGVTLRDALDKLQSAGYITAHEVPSSTNPPMTKTEYQLL